MPHYRIVALGQVFNIPDENTLHNRPIPPNHAKVSIDMALESDALLHVPNEVADISVVSDDLGTPIAWPVELIVLDSTVCSSHFYG